MALLGSGFDPGVTNVFCAYARDHLFDEIDTIDIVDCNGGDHGKAFATNFNPEINIREITQPGRYWKDGQWIEIDPLSERMISIIQASACVAFLLYHEEIEIARQEHTGPEADPILDDVRRQLPDALARAAECRPHLASSRSIMRANRSCRFSS